MPIQMDSDKLEARLIRLLMEGKPITIAEAAKELKVSKKKLERVVKGLESRGIVKTEELPDKTYLRLVRTDINFQGVNPSQEKAVKHKGSKKGEKEENRSTDMMYG